MSAPPTNSLSKESSASVRGALGWSLAGRYANLAVGLGSSMILARLLTPAQIGLFSMCAAAMLIAGTLRDFGVSDYLIQERELTREKLRGAFAFAIACAWLIGALIYLARPLLARWYDEPAIESLIGIQMIAFLVLPLSSPAYALLHRELAFGKVFMADFSATLAGAATSIVLAAKGFGSHSLAWGAVAAIVAQSTTVTILRPRNSLLWPTFGGTRAILRFGAYHVSSRMLENSTSMAHEFIIAKSFGFSSVGLFSRAKGLVDMFHSNVTSAVSRVATPAMARAHRADESLVDRFAHGTAVFTGLAWPFFVFIALCAPEIMLVLFGPQWTQAGAIARVLAIAMLPSGLYALGNAVFSAMGKVRERFFLTLQWCPVHIIALVAASLLGFERIAFAWWITNCAIALFFARELRLLLKCRYSAMYRASVASLAVVAAAGFPVAAALAIVRALQWPALPTLAVACLVGGLSWLAAVRVASHPAWSELCSLGRGLSKRTNT